MLLLALLALWIVPVATYRYARSNSPSHAYCAAGIALGAVVSPASLGAYGLYWLAGSLGWIALPLALIGILGLALTMFHGEPGFYLTTKLGLRSSREMVHGMEFIYIDSLNAIVWSAVYGTIGYLFDSIRRRLPTRG